MYGMALVSSKEYAHLCASTGFAVVPLPPVRANLMELEPIREDREKITTSARFYHETTRQSYLRAAARSAVLAATAVRAKLGSPAGLAVVAPTAVFTVVLPLPGSDSAFLPADEPWTMAQLIVGRQNDRRR